LKKTNSIRNDPDIKNLLSRLPSETALSLTNKQLSYIKEAVSNEYYRKHKIDYRGTIPIPFYSSRVYFVLLLGRNLRNATRNEKSIALITISFLSLSTLPRLVVINIHKSALGINLFEEFSLDLWDWLKQTIG
jgi:hypothetical protein